MRPRSAASSTRGRSACPRADHRRAIDRRRVRGEARWRRPPPLKVGDPRSDDTVIGPLINRQALSTVARHGCRTPSTGVRTVLVGGESEGPCYQPTAGHGRAGRRAVLVRGDVRPGRLDRDRGRRRRGGRACQRDGLRPRRPESSPATTSVASSWRGGSQSGIVHVNDQTVGDEPQMPFGGVKDSGWGRFGAGSRRGVHGAALGDHPGRRAALPVLRRPVIPLRRRRVTAGAVITARRRSRASGRATP